MEEFSSTKRAVGMMLMLALGPGDYVLTQKRVARFEG